MSGIQGYPTDPTQSTGTVGTSGGNTGTTITEDATTVKSFNNALRGIVGDLGAYRNDTSAAITSTGGGTAYILATNSQISALADGLRLSWLPHTDNTGAATLNVDTLGARKLLHDSAVLVAGEIKAGHPVDVVYDASADSAAGAWLVLNPVIVVASVGSDDVGNDSGVTGATVSAALDQLDTDVGAKVPRTSATGSAVMPSGTTAQRDGSPVAGYTRWNSTVASMEVWDGTDWALVGGGSNQYDTEIALLNMAMADALNVAQFIGDAGNRYADSFDALTYIDNAGATNLDVSEAGVLKPTSAVGTDQTATHTGYTTSGNTVSSSTDSATVEAWKAFDKLTGNASAENTWQATTTTGYIQYQFGSAKTIASYTILAQATSTGGAAAPNTWTLEGSNTGAFAGEETVLDTQGSVTWSNAEEKSFTISNPGSYAYYRLDVTANNGHSILGIDEIALLSAGATNNMTVETTGLSAASAPSTMRAYLTIEAIDSVTLNTDLTVRLSRDGGTTWATTTLSELFTTGSNKVLDTGEVDVSGQPSGTAPTMEIATANNKSVKVHAHYVYWS